MNRQAAAGKGKRKAPRLRFRYGFAAVPVVTVLILVVLGLSVNSVYSMQQSIIVSLEQGCADTLGKWAESVTAELELHRSNIEGFFDDQEAMGIYISGTYGQYESYPLGIYMGDDTGYYYDGSGWSGGDDYVVTERPWYQDGKDSRDFVFGEPYLDAMTGKICISVSARLDWDEAVRVLAADMYMDYPQQLVRALHDTNELDEVMLVAGQGRVVMAASQSGIEGSDLSAMDVPRYQKAAELIADGAEADEGLVCTVSGRLNRTRAYLVSVPGTGWYIVTYMKDSTLLAPLLRFLPLAALLGILAVAALVYLAGKYVRSVAEMEHRATTDKLTGILNREGFRRAVEPDGQTITTGMLILLDLDNFKSVNDNLGHPEGDRVLVLFAELMKQFFDRSTNRYARIGGDEFAVVIEHEITTGTAVHMLERFNAKVHETFDETYGAYGLSVSAGAAFCRPDRNYTALYKRADELLYQAKTDGKGRFHVEEMPKT